MVDEFIELEVIYVTGRWTSKDDRGGCFYHFSLESLEVIVGTEGLLDPTELDYEFPP
jgi:hypothetical protein